MSQTTNIRLKELDFLRGIAIILVLFRHINVNTYLFNMGWIGVDLFFVLSGFLVGGLIFKEIKTFGSLDLKLFLIRRGFKIYPLYYLTYPIYLLMRINEMGFDRIGFISDMAFIQNYIWGFGYAYPASWSLAIEEHFYFLFSICIWFCCKRTFIDFNSGAISKKLISIMMCIFVICLLERLFYNIYYFSQGSNIIKLFTYTHLRIDSLSFGVLLAYQHQYNYEQMKDFFLKNKLIITILAICGLSWTPFIDPLNSFFVKTFGFTILYLSFGSIIMLLLLSDKKPVSPKLIFFNRLVNIICKFGISSYSIYIIHTFVIKSIESMQLQYSILKNHFVYFFLCFVLSYILGVLLTILIENKFLKWRNVLFPNRILSN